MNPYKWLKKRTKEELDAMDLAAWVACAACFLLFYAAGCITSLVAEDRIAQGLYKRLEVWATDTCPHPGCTEGHR